MRPLSTEASFIVHRMEADRAYDVQDLRALIPDTSIERLREIMHELWLNRLVERAGPLSWRRHRPVAPTVANGARKPVLVKPEELFDHAAFEDFFK